MAKAQVLGAATAAMRGKLKRFINKEDADWLAGHHVDVDDPAVQRIFRAHRNDLEALVPFMIVGALYVWSGASPSVGIAYFTAFLMARFAHTFAYVGGHARMRRNMFTIAWLLNFIIGIHALAVLVPQVR
jgi:uncharacterized MAPEG superfamily protein